MANAFSFLSVAVIWWAFFHAIRLGALDPHNLAATPGRWATLAQSALALFAFIMFGGAKPAEPQIASFFAMFVLSQVVAPAFTFKDRLREDEQPSAFLRWWEGVKSSLGGSILMTLLSLLLAFTTGWLIGNWWFAILLFIGFMLVNSKATIAMVMGRAEDGELVRLPAPARYAKLNELASVCMLGRIGYLLGGVCVGFVVFREANLEPRNWSGWVGVVFGSVCQWVRVR